MKKTVAAILLCTLLCLCLSAFAGEEIPAGHLRVTEVKLEDMATLGDIIAQTDTGEEVILSFPDTWFEGAELDGITMTGSLHIAFTNDKMTYDLGESLLKCTFVFEDGERILPLGVGTTLPYEKVGGEIKLSWEDPAQELLDRLEAQGAEEDE